MSKTEVSLLEGEKLCLICLFPRTKTPSFKTFEVRRAFDLVFKYPVKRLFAGSKRGNNVFLVLLDPFRSFRSKTKENGKFPTKNTASLIDF